jgi:glycosyltransferase involved in cell wall biosynthesis
MKAVLFPNLTEFPSTSMKRYAAELSAALMAIAPSEWELDVQICGQLEIAARVLPGALGRKTAERLGRLVKYPMQAARARGDVFHVLDHSHANLALRLPYNRTVMTCHDLIPLLAAKGELDMQSSRLGRKTFPLRVRCMQYSRALIAISESTKRDLMRHAGIPEERIRVVYYGVNPRFGPEPGEGLSRADERRQVLSPHGIPESARVVLHVGTPNRYKNVPALLQALRYLKEMPALGENVYLLRVGAGFFDDELELVRSLGLTERVVFAGMIRQDTALAAYYRAADVLAFPSLWEGFGWPPLEAMACGTPVVTSNVASLPEVVGDAGITVAPHDHIGLGEALLAVLTDSELACALSARARARAASFTWEACARGTLSVYETLLAAARTGNALEL